MAFTHWLQAPTYTAKEMMCMKRKPEFWFRRRPFTLSATTVKAIGDLLKINRNSVMNM